MSQFYVSGPAETWISPPNTALTSSNALYVGFSRNGISVRITPNFEDIEVDYAGNVPGDVAFMGEEAAISGEFARYNETVVNTMLQYLPGSSQPAGTGINGAIGSLIFTEGYAYQLLVYSPYNFKNTYSGTMVPGFLFSTAYLANPYEVTLSIRTKKPQLGWRAIPSFGTIDASTYQVGTPYNAFQLYSTVMPSPMPTPN